MFASSVAYARPFWTEKSSYSEGTRTYFVGIATAKKNLETARQEATDNARKELMNFLQISHTKAIPFQTQMTHEEKASDGSTTVYRLMFVEAADIERFREAQLKLESETHAKTAAALEKRLEKTSTMVALVKKKEAQIEEKQSELDSIMKRIDEATASATNKLKCGMTKSEVMRVAGKPSSTANCLKTDYYNYGRVWALFESGTLACLIPTGEMSSCRSCSSGIALCN